MYKTVHSSFLVFNDNIFLLLGKCPVPMLYLLSYHAIKDNEIYKDVVLHPGNLKIFFISKKKK